MPYFPIQSLMSYDLCYELLSNVLHPDGFRCKCGKELIAGQCPHKRSSTGLPSFRCKQCRSIYNIFSGSILAGVHYNCILLVLILRGIIKGETTQTLSKELGLNYKNLLDWQHILQEFAYENRVLSILEDKVIESDEVFINAGEKGVLHPNLEDPARVRARYRHLG